MAIFERQNQPQAEDWQSDPLMDAITGADKDSGEYTEYIGHLRGLAAGAVTNIKMMMSQCEFKDPKDRMYVTNLLDGGEYQLCSEAAMREYRIDEAQGDCEKLMGEIRQLTQGIRRNRKSARAAGDMRLRAQKLQALNDVERRLNRLLHDRRRDLEDGVFYSAKPFIEFLQKPEEERRGQSFSHLMPPELQRAETVMAGYISAGAAWFVHNQSIAAQMLTGAALGRNIGFGDLASMAQVRPGRLGRMQRPNYGVGQEYNG